MEYSPKKFQEQFIKYGFNLKKMYGQNFIIDENTITSIIEKSVIDKETLVIEIGPGAGSLTYKLSKYAKNVVCYEIDTSLKKILEENITSSNVEIIYEDFVLVRGNKDYYLHLLRTAKLNPNKLYVLNGVNSDSGLKVLSSDYHFVHPYEDLNDLIDHNSLIYEMMFPNGNRYIDSPKFFTLSLTDENTHIFFLCFA